MSADERVHLAQESALREARAEAVLRDLRYQNPTRIMEDPRMMQESLSAQRPSSGTSGTSQPAVVHGWRPITTWEFQNMPASRYRHREDLIRENWPGVYPMGNPATGNILTQDPPIPETITGLNGRVYRRMRECFENPGMFHGTEALQFNGTWYVQTERVQEERDMPF